MTDLQESYDVIVIGGGPIGLSTAHECAKTEKKVLLLEKSIFFNQSGSSGDLVRMFRTAYTEDFMAKLAFQAMSSWNDLEKESGRKLRDMSGLLNFGDPKYGAGGPEGTLFGPIPNLEKFGLKYTELTRDQIQEANPFRELPEDWKGLDLPDNGCIDVPRVTRTLYKLCEDHHVDLRQYADVQRIVPDPDVENGWIVSGLLGTDEGASVAPKPFAFKTIKIAITAGAYVNHILYPSFGFSFNLDIWEMVYAYYAIDSKVEFPKMWFQFAEDTPGKSGTANEPKAPISNLFYGFPSVPWGPPNMARIAVDAATQVIKDPSQRSESSISPADLENVRQFVLKHIDGAGPNPLPVFAGQCLQTNVFDNMFVLDYIPDELMPGAGPRRSKSIAVFTAGWAMKFVPLIGTIMKELLLDGGTNEYDISHFRMTRMGNKGESIVQHCHAEQSSQRVAPPVGSSKRC